MQLDLDPAPARRFLRAPRPAGDAPAGDVDPPVRRRIVLSQDDDSSAAPEADRADTTGRGPDRPSRRPVVDVDFDFGRAAEHARRRTAERLGHAVPGPSVAPSSAASAGDDGVATGSDRIAAADGGSTGRRPASATIGAPAAAGTHRSRSPRPTPQRPGAQPLAAQPSAAPRPAAQQPAVAQPPVALAPPPARTGLFGRTVRPAGTTPSRRPRPPRDRQVASQPDRIALWAVLLGIFLVALAAASSRADAATHGAPDGSAALERTAAPRPPSRPRSCARGLRSPRPRAAEPARPAWLAGLRRRSRRPLPPPRRCARSPARRLTPRSGAPRPTRRVRPARHPWPDARDRTMPSCVARSRCNSTSFRVVAVRSTRRPSAARPESAAATVGPTSPAPLARANPPGPGVQT
jgi:hypothetical protein